MANQELTWVNVQADDLSPTLRKMYDKIGEARKAFQEAMVHEARKAGSLGADESLVIAHKGWGFGMAKTKAKTKATAKANSKSLFASL